jgi:hypothetical protein
MKKGNRGNSKQGLKRGGQTSSTSSKGANFQFPSFLKYGDLKKYATEKNIYMALGIATAVGGVTYLAFKYVPWDRIREKMSEEFDAVQEQVGEFSPETVDAL